LSENKDIVFRETGGY